MTNLVSKVSTGVPDNHLKQNGPNSVIEPKQVEKQAQLEEKVLLPSTFSQLGSDRQDLIHKLSKLRVKIKFETCWEYILKAFVHYKDDAEVIALAVRAVNALVLINESNIPLMMDREALSLVKQMMIRFINNEQIVANCCTSYGYLAFSKYRPYIGESGVIDLLLAVMTKYESSILVNKAVCGSFAILALQSEICEAIMEKGALKYIIQAMKMNDAAVVNKATECLCVLAQKSSTNQRKLVGLDVAGLINNAMVLFSKDEKLKRNLHALLLNIPIKI